MHQSVNLLPDCITLAFLGVKNLNFPRGPQIPLMEGDIKIIVRKTVTLQG